MEDYVRRSDVLRIIKRTCTDYSAAYNLIGRMKGIKLQEDGRQEDTGQEAESNAEDA